MTEGWTDELLSQKLAGNKDLKVVTNNATKTPITSTRKALKDQTSRRHPEKDLEQFVHNTAKTFNLLYYHTYRSRFSEPGFLDCFIIGRYMLVAELKDTGKKPTPAQQEWLDAFRTMGIPVYIWHPEDKDEIIKILSDMSIK